MSQLFVLPFQVPFNSSAPLGLAKLYFFAAGTTNHQAVYTTAALSVAHDQPVRSDAAGVFPPIYLNPNAAADYRIQLKTAAEVLVSGGDVDNIPRGSTDADFIRYDLTAAEIAAGVTPVNYSYAPRPRLDLSRFGTNTTPGTTDMASAINNALLVLTFLGGGTVLLNQGENHRCNSSITLYEGCGIDYNGGKITSHLSGTNDVGVQIRSYTSLENGEHEVVSTGSPGSQGSIHSAFLIGALYGTAGTVASPSSDAVVTNVTIRNMKSWTDKTDGGTGLGIIGGVTNVLIENFQVPDSTTMLYGISMDWGYVGTLTSSTDAGISAGKTAFLAGTMYTLHPNNISMRNVKIGALSRAAATHGVRISGCHNVYGQNVTVKKSTYAAFFHTAGDAGYEFAPAEQKPWAHQNIIFDNFNVEDAGVGWGCYIDGYADNVASAVTNIAYVPLLPAIAPIGVTLRRFRTQSNAGASAIPGFRIQNCIGGVLEDCEATLHSNGLLGETGSDGVHVIRGRFYANRNKGILVGHNSDLPQDWVIRGARVYGNATATSTEAGIRSEGTNNMLVTECIVGASGEATQLYGIHADATTTNLSVIGNKCPGLKSSGIAYAMGAATTDYAVLFVFENNTSSAPTHFGGVDIIPYSRQMGPDGVVRGEFFAAKAVLSSDTTPDAAFPGKAGDKIYYTDPSATGYIGTRCRTAGTPGTWERWGISL